MTCVVLSSLLSLLALAGAITCIVYAEKTAIKCLGQDIQFNVTAIDDTGVDCSVTCAYLGIPLQAILKCDQTYCISRRNGTLVVNLKYGDNKSAGFVIGAVIISFLASCLIAWFVMEITVFIRDKRSNTTPPAAAPITPVPPARIMKMPKILSPPAIHEPNIEAKRTSLSEATEEEERTPDLELGAGQ